MRVIIAGSRSLGETGWETNMFLERAMGVFGHKPSVVLSGHALGVDRMGERWAKRMKVELEIYPAQWQRYGKAAGMVRNEQMVRRAEGLVALWDGMSKGTANVIDLAVKANLWVLVYIPEDGYIRFCPHPMRHPRV